MQKPLIIAHRGESFDAPENTMAAIKLAWERDAEAVEIDIQLTKDNELVVIHDTDTKRLTGIDKKIKDQTLEELKKLDVGSWKDITFKDERIPTLKEVLSTVPEGKRLIVEIKSGPETVTILKSAINQFSLAKEQIEIIGFDLETMIQARNEFPENKVLWLLDLDYNWHSRIFEPSIAKGIDEAKNNKLDGLNVWAGKMLSKNRIDQIHDAGLLAYCWTVNEIDKAHELSEWGIDAITTDGAQWLSHHLFN